MIGRLKKGIVSHTKAAGGTVKTELQIPPWSRPSAKANDCCSI